MFPTEFSITEEDSITPTLRVQGIPCARNECPNILGATHFWSQQEPGAYYCSLGCASTDLAGLKMCAIWNKLMVPIKGTAVGPLFEQAPVEYDGAVWYRVWSGEEYPYTGDEWWDGVLECREGQEPVLHDMLDSANPRVTAVRGIMFEE